MKLTRHELVRLINVAGAKARDLRRDDTKAAARAEGELNHITMKLAEALRDCDAKGRSMIEVQA